MLQRFTLKRTGADLDRIIRARHGEHRGTTPLNDLAIDAVGVSAVATGVAFDAGDAFAGAAVDIPEAF